MEENKKKNKVIKAVNTNPVSLKKQAKKETPIDAQERLSEIMNDNKRVIKICGENYYISALRMGTQWLIAEEAIKIIKVENANMGDIIKQFAKNIPSVVHCIALALLNDKDRIYKDIRSKEYSDEYNTMYDKIMWESDENSWINILFEVLSLINVEVFFYTIDAIQMIREMTLKRKMMKNEQR